MKPISFLIDISASAIMTSENRIFDFNLDFDVIGTLPLELAVMIFRLLDAKTLINAATVRRKWCQIIQGDKILRQRVYEQLVNQRVRRRNLENGRVLRQMNGVSRDLLPVRSFKLGVLNQFKSQKRKLEILDGNLCKKFKSSIRLYTRLR